VPSEVTGGGPTIAIRIPAHPVALALINACGFPIAAPSANTSGEISATKGSHISKELMENVAMMLDAGQTEGGIESTVIDLTISPPQIKQECKK
jgi:L-threonylcarbamoyladenylate synthase